MDRSFQVQLKIRKPVAEVFDAVVNPKKLTGYFTKTASGPMTEGSTVMWSFVEFPGEFPVKVRQVVQDSKLVFNWESEEGGYDTTVEMEFKPLDDKNTMVLIREHGWKESPKATELAMKNHTGWMHMVCSMKASLEYGINLREGGVM